MIKYIGSKRVLVPHIVQGIAAFPKSQLVLDAFSGTARVGHALKAAGHFVVANDHMQYAATLACTYVQADAKQWHEPAQKLLLELQDVEAQSGYFMQTFCKQSRFFQEQNGAKIDAIRERIAKLDLPEELLAIALTSLMEAADRVDSTTGVQMAYLKAWAPRAYNDLELRVPKILPGTGTAHCGDALSAVSNFDGDVIYLDPPYNQHRYLGNYHIWETLVRWDKPEHYGIACKRIDCREYKSEYNSKKTIATALQNLIQAARTSQLLVSFNDEGHVSSAEMQELLSHKGYVAAVPIDFKRYVGAQIGIYNPSGEKVGKIGALRNKEYLFVVASKKATATRVAEVIQASVAQELAQRIAKPKARATRVRNADV